MRVGCNRSETLPLVKGVVRGGARPIVPDIDRTRNRQGRALLCRASVATDPRTTSSAFNRTVVGSSGPLRSRRGRNSAAQR